MPTASALDLSTWAQGCGVLILAEGSTELSTSSRSTTMGTPDEPIAFGPKLYRKVRGTDEMVSTEDTSQQTGTPFPASALCKSHYNPDLRVSVKRTNVGTFLNKRMPGRPALACL